MDEEPDRKRAALSASSTTHIVQDGLTSTIYVLLPVLSQVFGFTYAEVGLLKGVKNGAQGVLELASGWLSERVGEVRLLAIGLVLSGIGYAVLSIAPDAGVVMACIAVVGVGTALHHAPSSSLVVTFTPRKSRSSALGIYNASGDVGKLLFTACFSLLTSVGFAWAEISFAYGLAGLFAAVVVLAISRSLHHRRRERLADKQAGGEGVPGWGILDKRAFGAVIGVTSLDVMVQTAILVFMPFLMLAKGLPLWLATASAVVLLAGGVFGKAACGFLADRMGARSSFALIQLLTALGLFGAIVAPGASAIVLLLPLGAVAQGSTSITYGLAADLIHSAKMARGYALLYGVGTAAGAVGPFAFGLIADGIGIAATMGFMAVTALLTIPLFFLVSLPAEEEQRDADVAKG